MKKKNLLFFSIAAMALASCTTVRKTASTLNVNTDIEINNKGDLEVAANRVSYSFRPNKTERRGGKQNVLNCATSALLEANGGADVLVAPQYTMRIRTGIFHNKTIKEVIISGYPAKYKNLSNKK